MKRLIDFIVSATFLIILSPLLLILVLLIYWRLGEPVLYIQQRPGKDGKPFLLYKFRSMTNEVDDEGNLLPPMQRLTPFGSFLRSTSLDELPELINVIKGDMSLVGPRPLLMEYLQYYSSRQARRHEVKPGITGWAQINGRNSITWEEKFELDVWYVENRSLMLDIRILLGTVKQVIFRTGINHSEKVPMPKFRGTPERGE